MPFSTRFTPDGLGVIQLGEGAVSGAEILEDAIEINRVPERVATLRYGLADFTGTTALHVTAAHVRSIAEENEKTAALAPRVSVAIVAPSDHVYGVARMWEFHADGASWETWVFRDRAAAIAWLRERCPGAVPDGPS